MDYPNDFPASSRAAVTAENIRAGIEFEGVRNMPWHAGKQTSLEAALRVCILRPFVVFVREAAKLGINGTWTVDEVDSLSREFLRRATIDAQAERAYDLSGHRFAEDWIENWAGNIQDSVRRRFQESEQWREFQILLLAVADSQAGITNHSSAGLGPGPPPGIEIGPNPEPKKRGRPPIPVHLKQKAWDAKMAGVKNPELAKILYETPRPTPQQKSDVSNLLKNFKPTTLTE